MFAAGWTAAGWIPAIKAFFIKGSLKTVADVPNPRGWVNKGKDFYELINAQRGAVEADKKWDITGKALRHQTRDMEKYLERKMRRDAERFGR